jgi:predicted transcriptional regulator of viral defense system
VKINVLSEWVESLQASGRYTFLRKQAAESTGLSVLAARKALLRLDKRKRVAKVKDYFYVIVPTEYRNAGSPPASWFIHDLMAAMGRLYYVGLLTAASLHGASHQQPQEFQVVTASPVRPVQVAGQRLHFLVNTHIERTPVTLMKTPTGQIRVSTVEATVVDLVRFHKAAGYLGNVATVIAELADQLQPDALLRAAKVVGELAVIQRLGYILDLVGAAGKAEPLAAWVHQQDWRATPLAAGRAVADASRNSRWNVIENEKIEAEV